MDVNISLILTCLASGNILLFRLSLQKNSIDKAEVVLRNTLLKPNRSRRGAFSCVLFLFTCLGLLILGSIGIDASHAFYARRQLQNAADNAALTGAFYLSNLAP